MVDVPSSDCACGVSSITGPETVACPSRPSACRGGGPPPRLKTKESEEKRAPPNLGDSLTPTLASTRTTPPAQAAQRRDEDGVEASYNGEWRILSEQG